METTASASSASSAGNLAVLDEPPLPESLLPALALADSAQSPAPAAVSSWESHGVRIAESPGRGRGVFATHHFRPGEVIDICPVLTMPASSEPHLDRTALYHYYFAWGPDQVAVVLGTISLVNHSYAPSARYVRDFARQRLVLYCLREITAGEEITINYNGDPRDQSPLWFDVV